MRTLAIVAIYCGASVAHAGQTILKCDATEILTKESASFSIVFEEARKSVVVNGSAYQAIEFKMEQVKGKQRQPYISLQGFVLETSFSIDRVTGKFFFGTVLDTESGRKPTDAEIKTIDESTFKPVAFLGTCVKTRPQF